MDFSAIAFKSSIPAFKAVEVLEEDWAVKAAAEAAREAKMASFMVTSFYGDKVKRWARPETKLSIDTLLHRSALHTKKLRLAWNLDDLSSSSMISVR